MAVGAFGALGMPAMPPVEEGCRREEEFVTALLQLMEAHLVLAKTWTPNLATLKDAHEVKQ